jgi:hypothetical protein
MFNGSSNQVFDRILNLLLSWHANDPVSARELREIMLFMQGIEILY